MRIWLGTFVLGLSLLAGCDGRDNFLVKVTFPDDQAREQARSLRVVVVEPAEDASCTALEDGTAVPGDAGYDIEDQTSFNLPAPGDIEPLGEVGAGRRLFYADAEDESGEVFLRGCTEVRVGEKESRLVIIDLERVSKPCEGDADCDDSNDCTTDWCEQSKCSNEAVLDDTDCGLLTCSGLAWIQPKCVSGECTGSETVSDCEDGNDCTRDTCDDVNGCDNQPSAAGTDCGVCTVCDGQGACIEDLTQDDDCAPCQECTTGGGCVNQAAGSDVKGECTDGLFCNGLEACDGSGGCQAGSDPCAGLTCIEDSDTCEGCLADAECPPCLECDAGGVCVNQPEGSDLKDECAADACNPGNCDGAGACGRAVAGTDCGVCAACDGAGVCIRDLTQDGDCPLCQECRAAGDCVNQAAGDDVKGECIDSLFCNGLETCDGAGGCQAGSDPCPGTECNTCQEDTDTCLDPAGTPCDDGDSCSSQDECDGSGSCVSGATDKDTDGDGYYDRACPGGDDCDDGAISVNPGAVEGPNGDPTCGDGADNDCDGQTDECSAQEGYRKPITIDPTRVSGSSDLPDFPVLISIAGDNDLRTTANGGHVENANGYDITFRASDGTTRLDHEVENYDSTSGTLVAWVRIPTVSVSAATIIYVYYGYSGVTSPTENPTAVWDNSYVGVWHLKEDATDTGTVNLYTDSTANANHGDDYVSASGKGGQIYAGQAFDGIDDYIDCGNDSSLDVGYLTIEFWLNVNTWVSDGGILAKGDNSYRQYWIWTYGGEVAFEIDEGGNINYAWAATAGQWEHLAITYDGANATTYRNGAQENSYPQATGVIDATTPPLLLGTIPSYRYADFALDELRVSDIARSIDWITTGYNNQNSPSTFYSIGSEETP